MYLKSGMEELLPLQSYAIINIYELKHAVSVTQFISFK